MPMISYAQNREDVLLARAFPAATGFYLDIGAADPVEYSVTKWFSDQGWAGVNVEPQAGYFSALSAARPRDINLNIGLSDRPGTLTLFEAPTRPGWSTMQADVADRFRREGIEVIERVVPVRTLAEVCADHAPAVIDFLKLDVEGHEEHVLRGADFSRWRPRALVIEATEVGRPDPAFGWEPLVVAAGYSLATFDGLNRYYVRDEDRDLVPVFQVPANVYDQYTPFEWLARVEERDRLLAERQAWGEKTAADRDAQRAEAAHYREAFRCRTLETEGAKAQAAHLEEAFRCRTLEADALRARVDEVAAQLAHFQEAFRCRTGEAEVLAGELAAAAERVAETQARLVGAEDRLADTRARLGHTRAALAHAREHLDALRTEVYERASGQLSKLGV